MDIAQLAYRVDSSDLDKANAKLADNERAADRAEGASGRLQRAWNRLQGVAKGLAAAKTVLVAGLTAIAIRTARYIQEVALMSQQIGVSTQALSSMRYAAEQMANVGSGQFDMALRRMTRRITEAAAGGGPAAAAIEAMGLSARELARLSPDEQFRRIADAMRNTSDQGTRLRHTMALMDTEGMPLVNMLSQGADAIREMEGEAEELGLTLGRDTIRQAEEFRRTMARMRAMVQGMAIQVATNLLPTLNEFASLLNSDGFKQGFQTIVNGAVTAAQKLAEFAVTTANVTTFLAEEVAARIHGAAADDIVRLEQEAERIRKQLEFVAKRPRTAAVGNWMRDVIGLPTSDELEARLSQLDTLIRDYYANPPTPGPGRKTVEDFFNPTNLDFNFDPTALLAGAAAEAVEQLEDSSDRAREQFLAMSMALSGPVAEASYRYAVELQNLRDLADEAGVSASALAEAEGNLARQHEANMEAIQRRLNPVDELIRHMEDELALMRMSHADREMAIRLRRLDAEATDEQVSAIRRLLQEQDGQRDLIEQMDAVRYAGSEFLSDWATGAKSFGDAMEDSLKRLHHRLVQIAMDRVIQQLLGGFGTAGGGSWGAALSSLFGGGRRHGGPTRGDRMYRVGEGGEPELLNLGPGRQYLIPGDHGRVEPMSHAAPVRQSQPQSQPPVKVEIINNTNAEVRTESGRTPDGAVLERIIIGTVGKGLARGDFDGQMGGLYGMQRKGVALG